MNKTNIHTWVFKIILALIMLSFVAWSLPSMLQIFVNSDVVKFKNVKNIGKQEMLSHYLKLKASNQEFEAMDNELLYEKALQQLMQKRLSDNLIEIYGLKLEKDDAKKFIAERNNLKDEKGQLDLKKFQEIARNNRIAEFDLLNELKYWLLREQIINSFILNVNTPNILKKHLNLYSTEIRQVRVVGIDKFNTKFVPSPTFTDEVLEDFYLSNKELFIIPEKRSFRIVSLLNKDVASNINITEDDAKNYIKKENIESGENISIKEAKNILQQQKIHANFAKIVEEIEDQLAAGADINDIIKEFKLNSTQFDNKTLNQIESKQDLANRFTKEIFSLQEEETSQIIQKEDGIFLCNVIKIEPSNLPAFSDIKIQVEKSWKNLYYIKENAKFLENFIASNKNNLNAAVKKNNIEYTAELKIDRTNSEINESDLDKLFDANLNDKAIIFTKKGDKKLYAGIIKNISYDSKMISNKELFENYLTNEFKSLIFAEIMKYMNDINEVEIYDDQELLSTMQQQ